MIADRGDIFGFRCRLNDEDIRIAKEMGLNPRSLIKNIPSKSEPWKSPVKDWIHEMYQKRQEKTAKKKSRKEQNKKNTNKSGCDDNHLYTLDVFIIRGPMTEAFVKENPVISRTIQIRGDQTLEQLHNAIFSALDREEEHMYEFQLGKGPMDPKGKRYVLPMALVEPIPGPHKPAGDVNHTTIRALDLNVDEAFGYWFDFGDDWCHQINVVSIERAVPGGKYPQVTKRVGGSPPQYIDWDKKEE